ncbi:MAG: AMP-binding protein, partial [Nannocystaceae bacterium]
MNFIETILGQLGQRGELTALTEIHGASQKPFTAAEVAEMVASARGTLLEHGLKPGQRVALLAPNSTRWAAADLAIVAQGGIVVPLYARQDPHELAVMTRDCAPSLLIAGSQELADAIKTAWPEACEVILLRDLFDGDTITDPPVALKPEDPVTIIYTSGTSGVPKGVILTCQNVDFMIPQTASSVHAITGARGAPDRVFHFLPFCFAGSRVMLWTQLYRGNPLMMSTDLTNLVQEMATSNPHYYLNVPAVLERIRNGVGQKIRARGGLVAKLYAAGVAAGLRLQAGHASPLDRFVAGFAGRLIFPKIKQQIGSNLE